MHLNTTISLILSLRKARLVFTFTRFLLGGLFLCLSFLFVYVVRCGLRLHVTYLSRGLL